MCFLYAIVVAFICLMMCKRYKQQTWIIYRIKRKRKLQLARIHFHNLFHKYTHLVVPHTCIYLLLMLFLLLIESTIILKLGNISNPTSRRGKCLIRCLYIVAVQSDLSLSSVRPEFRGQFEWGTRNDNRRLKAKSLLLIYCAINAYTHTHTHTCTLTQQQKNLSPIFIRRRKTPKIICRVNGKTLFIQCD